MPSVPVAVTRLGLAEKDASAMVLLKELDSALICERCHEISLNYNPVTDKFLLQP
ncbi:hypothetical protein GCM10023352_17200 [Rothia endophytica]|uniref:Uncharacterized protein n=1 Tax=Rothia endophytica TaxID=1324766 RepID=A0ABP9BR49_9MICC